MLTCSEFGFASVMNHPHEDPDFVFETEFENGDSETDDVTRRESKCLKLQHGKNIVTLRCSSRHSFAYRHEFIVLHLSISIKEV